MKNIEKKIITFLFVSLAFIAVQANTPYQYLKTAYTDGEFVTVCRKEVNGNVLQSNAVILQMIEQLNNKPMKLFDWVLKDLGLQGQKNDEMIIVLKKSMFDKSTGITHGLVDVIIPNFQTIRDVKVDAVVKTELLPNGQLIGSVVVVNSGFLLKNAYATITSSPMKNGNQLLQTETHIQFGWLLKFFITQNRYKSIVEWRIDKFTENMQKEAEKNTYSQTIY